MNNWPADPTMKAISNFRISYLRVVKNPDGTVTRRVRLKNVHGETSQMAELPASALASPEKFRTWCLNRGNFVWTAGTQGLSMLASDICQPGGSR